MGSDDQSINVVFDTGTLGLAVQGSACTTNCAAALYDETVSGSAGSTPWTYTYKSSQTEDYWITATGVDNTDIIKIDGDTLNTARFYLVNSLSMASGDTFTPSETGWLGLTMNKGTNADGTFDFIE